MFVPKEHWINSLIYSSFDWRLSFNGNNNFADLARLALQKIRAYVSPAHISFVINNFPLVCKLLPLIDLHLTHCLIVEWHLDGCVYPSHSIKIKCQLLVLRLAAEKWELLWERNVKVVTRWLLVILSVEVIESWFSREGWLELVGWLGHVFFLLVLIVLMGGCLEGVAANLGWKSHFFELIKIFAQNLG